MTNEQATMITLSQQRNAALDAHAKAQARVLMLEQDLASAQAKVAELEVRVRRAELPPDQAGPVIDKDALNRPRMPFPSLMREAIQRDARPPECALDVEQRD